MRSSTLRSLALAAGVLASIATGLPAKDSADLDAQADIDFALDALEEQCGQFFELKHIDWKAVRKEFANAGEGIEDLGALHHQLTRLLARLDDGHAQVRLLDDSLVIEWPEEFQQRDLVGPGMFLVQIGKDLYVKESFRTAADLGLVRGSKIVKLDGEKPLDWLTQRIARLRDTQSFSTEQQARAFTLTKGLADPAGTRLEVEFTEPGSRKKKKRTITYEPKVSFVPDGPAVMPQNIEGDSDLRWAELPSGHGWIHVRRCPGDLPERFDKALAALAAAPGIVLDFRGCSGGGFDHDALFGRFVPREETFGDPKTYASAGPNPYTGPVVVIVDGTVASAGETASGMFKEDGRAFMIGECATAGMSSSKTTIELPSGLLGLYVSVASNKGRFNAGRGIEGIGVPPDEVVEYDPEDLGAGRDTLIERAVELLGKMPKSVKFQPPR